ncbi:MAG: ATP-binding protein [Verrucomicrobia bacterium]|nr:ATP-binding protein [Verrucomicrobiota bacterium]
MSLIEIAPSRLRHGAEHLFGRGQEIKALDQAWDNPSTHILTIVAWGGVGKTSLVVEWMARKADAGWPGFERVFDWSFYSQGTREQAVVSADPFIAAALEFFGDPAMARSAALPWDKGSRLAQLVAQKRTLLVLDGLEPLQHPSGPSFAGQLRDPALLALLRGLNQRNPGLCLLTTREPIADLAPFHDTTAPKLELQRLSTGHGVKLVKRLGVLGTEAEFKILVEDVAGHALTLKLLGRYLTRAHGGDVRRRDHVKFEKADRDFKINPADADKPYGHAFKVMATYERWLGTVGESGRRQIAILYLLGLFDRPADAVCLAALRRDPVIPCLTEPLVGLSEEEWNLAVSALADCGLVQVQKEDGSPLPTVHSQASLHAHPLVREFFAMRLRKISPASTKAAHLRLFEHLQGSVPDLPESTDGLQPLYQAVAHGCQAGCYVDAFEKVLRKRIWRGDEFFSTGQYGLFSADLAALRRFFDNDWNDPVKELPRKLKARLWSLVGFRLRTISRLAEAKGPMRAALETHRLEKDWGDASKEARNLSVLYLLAGKLRYSARLAQKSVRYAEQSKDRERKVDSLAALGDALIQLGGDNTQRALECFRTAEKLQRKCKSAAHLLYSNNAFRYYKLLVDGKEYDEIIRSLDATKKLGLFLPRYKLLEEAVSNLYRGKAHFLRYLDHNSADDLRQAEKMLVESPGSLRQSGHDYWLVEGLLARASLWAVLDKLDRARVDLDDGWSIAEHGPMRLHLADIHLHRARIFRDKKELQKACALIEKCGYWRRKAELKAAADAAVDW